jgi:hypothetical protein
VGRAPQALDSVATWVSLPLAESVSGRVAVPLSSEQKLTLKMLNDDEKVRNFHLDRIAEALETLVPAVRKIEVHLEQIKLKK